MFERLKLYTVHTKTAKDGEVEDVQFVKVGYNFWASVFSIILIWPIYHRCWRLLALCLFIWGSTELLAAFDWLSFAALGALQLGGFFLVGLLANDELRRSLQQRGYEASDVVAEVSKIRAQLRYFDRLGKPSFL